MRADPRPEEGQHSVMGLSRFHTSWLAMVASLIAEALPTTSYAQSSKWVTCAFLAGGGVGRDIALIVVEPFPVPGDVTFAASISDRFHETVGVSTLVPGYKPEAFFGGIDRCDIYETEARARAKHAAWMDAESYAIIKSTSWRPDAAYYEKGLVRPKSSEARAETAAKTEAAPPRTPDDRGGVRAATPSAAPTAPPPRPRLATAKPIPPKSCPLTQKGGRVGTSNAPSEAEGYNRLRKETAGRCVSRGQPVPYKLTGHRCRPMNLDMGVSIAKNGTVVFNKPTQPKKLVWSCSGAYSCTVEQCEAGSSSTTRQ